MSISDEEFNKRMDEYYEWWKEEEKKETDEYKKKIDEKNKLCAELNRLDREFENNKLKRNLKTIALYTVINMFLSYFLLKLVNGEVEVTAMLIMLLPSAVLAGISFLINAVIFSQLLNKSNVENTILKEMEKRISVMDDELASLREEYR